MDNKLTMGFTPEQLKNELFSVAGDAMLAGAPNVPNERFKVAKVK